MKLSISTLTFILPLACVNGLPNDPNMLRDLRTSLKRTNTFNPEDQRVSVTGDHAWMAPDFAAGDRRGPCPGLNALANHGYLPRSGVGTALDFDKAITGVPRIGVMFAQILAFYGLATAGDGLSWSIGGTPKTSLPLIKGLGLDGTHNVYEGDASATRGDLFTTGTNSLMQLDLFKQLYFGPDGKPRNIDLKVLADHRAARQQNSIETNPYFFAAPVPHTLVVPAAHHFIFRLMGNKSAEFPDGQTTPEVFKTWFSVSGPDDDLMYTPGHERIPDNFYTRAADDPYEVNKFAEDVAYFIAEHPETAVVGGNTGTTNSFVGLDLFNLTNGVYSVDTLADGNNAACFGMQLIFSAAPSALLSVLGSAITELGCPQFSGFHMSQVSQFPGSAKLGKDGQY